MLRKKNNNISVNKHKAGFTLLELVLYVALASIIVAMALYYILFVFRSKDNIDGVSFLDQDMRLASRRIERAVKTALSVNLPSAGDSGDMLSLAMPDSEEDPTIFYINEGSLFMKKGSFAEQQITLPLVSVDSLTFNNYLDVVRWRTSASYKKQLGNILYEVSADWQNSFSLRP